MQTTAKFIMTKEKDGILENLIIELGISKSEFSAQIGVAPQALNSYLSGIRKVGRNFANRILKRYSNINIKYLLYGEQPMFIIMPALYGKFQDENLLLHEEIKVLRKRLELYEK